MTVHQHQHLIILGSSLRLPAPSYHNRPRPAFAIILIIPVVEVTVTAFGAEERACNVQFQDVYSPRGRFQGVNPNKNGGFRSRRGDREVEKWCRAFLEQQVSHTRNTGRQSPH